jgi:hypothetical protein
VNYRCLIPQADDEERRNMLEEREASPRREEVDGGRLMWMCERRHLGFR